MTTHPRPVLFLALLLPPLAPAPRQTPEAREADTTRRLERLVGTLESELPALHLPGLTLAVVLDDRVVLARGLGQADLEAGRAATPETIYAIGSTTKAFTATLAAILTDEGVLLLDDPITKHLPWFELHVSGPGPVTLRDLMSHRTGFARMDELWYGGRTDADTVLHAAVKAEPLGPMRRNFVYNNVMFLAAGQACAAAAGKSWETLVHEHLLEPLGMRSTTTSVAEAVKDARMARGYAYDAERKRFEPLPPRNTAGIAPAGAIHSNVVDLARWVRFLLGRGELEGQRLLTEETLARTFEPHNTVPPGMRYGLGWFLQDWEGEPMIQHGGNIDGFAAAIALLPGRNAGVVLLTNVGATPLQSSIGPRTFAALFGQEDAPAGDAKELQRFAGTYLASFFQFHEAQFVVHARPGALSVEIPGQSDFELAPPDEKGVRPFKEIPGQLQASFLEEDGAVVALVIHQNGLRFECYRRGYSPKGELDLAEFEPYLGRYTDPANGKTIELVVSHERLALDYPGQLVYELLPPDDLERWVFRATASMAIELQDEDSFVFHERGTERVCKRVGAGLPTVDTLLEARHAAAFEARLAALGTVRLEGTVHLVNCGIEGAARTTFGPGTELRDVQDLSPFFRSESLFDGTRGVAFSDLEVDGQHPLEGSALDTVLALSPRVLFGDWRKTFTRVLVLARVDSKEHELLRVRLERGESPPILVMLDPVSGDLLEAETEGLGAQRLRFEDWRELEGLRLPTHVVLHTDGTGEIDFRYERLETSVAEDWSPAAPAGEDR